MWRVLINAGLNLITDGDYHVPVVNHAAIA